ncbi:MAG: T9SS type A sorting domain-containing protein, partial [Muribaculaceae bacterium]|nr:T9SS type A sorting domain-containing protein [Muribaculaceae bacterium]
YDASTQQFSVKSFQAQYNEEEGEILFPDNAGMQWWLYDYSLEPMFPLDMYTIEGAVKVKKTINSLIINKGEEGSLQIKFQDFSRIDFKNGNLVFDTDDGLSIPLANLKTVHFDEYFEEDKVGDGDENGDDNASDSIASIELDSKVRLLYGKDWLAITGLQPGSSVNIFSLNGAKVISEKDYESQQIDISKLAPGVYVVNSGEYSFKIVK